MTHYHELVEREEVTGVAIEVLLRRIGERFFNRQTINDPLQCRRMDEERARDVTAIRGLVRAVRILRGAGR